MIEHEPDSIDLCRACGQVWPCRVQKLRGMANQTASPNEAKVAKDKLKAMGVSEQPAGPAYRPPARPSPRPREQRGYSFIDPEWLAQFLWGASRTNTMNEAMRRHNEALKKSQRAAEAFSEEVRRAAIPPCPGCGHREDQHISIRCYGCGVRTGRAQLCGWMYGSKLGDSVYEWFKAREPGFGGRRFHEKEG